MTTSLLSAAAEESILLSRSGEAFVDYFRCPKGLAALEDGAELDSPEGFFEWKGSTCYGRPTGCIAAPVLGPNLPPPAGTPHETAADRQPSGTLRLPFDLSAVAANLRQERYAPFVARDSWRARWHGILRDIYYFFRPVMPVGIRKHLQRLHLSGWDEIRFPRWPVDTTVDTLMRTVMHEILRQGQVKEIPFIWFWPNGANGCLLMTHDIEGPAGYAFSERLMEIDASFGMKAAFQVVPDPPGSIPPGFIDRVRRRGFEVNLHDLNHDGHLFRDKRQFLKRAAQINRYSKELDCRGFRSGAMYRNQEWYDAFTVSFDMSVPAVAHLEPQGGGCCTVMPYFVGNLLELPLTTTQDYSLLHILCDYSVELWKRQIREILDHNGLVSFIAHPDYVADRRALAVYCELLQHLSVLRETENVWCALPGDVDEWWRSRRQMRLVSDGAHWRIVGPESARARVACARLVDNQVIFTVSGE